MFSVLSLIHVSLCVITRLFVQAKEEEEKGVSALDLITQHIQQQQQQRKNINNNSNEADKYCLFFDESRGIECDVSLNATSSLYFLYFDWYE